MASQPRNFVTPEQYLERERAAATKSEYYRGGIYAMAGASEIHSLIVANLVGELRDKLRARNCRVYPSDMRLLVSSTGLYTYPDVMVVGGSSILADHEGDILTNPIVIIEVLSESTQNYDREGKFSQYRNIQSMQEYVTVSQSEQLVNHSVRQSDDSWLLRDIRGNNASLRLLSLDVQLKLSEIYEKVGLQG